MIDEAGINLAGERGDVFDATADQDIAGLAHEFLHLRRAPPVIRAPDVDQAGDAASGGMVEFTLGGRDALLVLKAVVVAKDAEVDVAARDFVEIDPIGAAVAGGQFLEQEHLGDEAAQHGIAEQEGFQVAPLLREFLLHAADE